MPGILFVGVNDHQRLLHNPLVMFVAGLSGNRPKSIRAPVAGGIETIQSQTERIGGNVPHGTR